MTMATGIRFEILSRCSENRARTGRLRLPHGEVETPCFMPVGTQGAVKTLGAEDLEALGYEMILANTYHLSLRPGEELIERLGGLHRFMSWKRPILTDSGGYQVMSLASRRTITEEGVDFQSHLDGERIMLTPERSVEIQRKLESDISMALDVCPSYESTRGEVAEGMRLTHEWAKRSLEARSDGQALFGIVQGGLHEELRKESVDCITSLPFDGFAVGGLSVGEPSELRFPIIENTVPMIPEERPRYLMGVGHPKEIIHAVKQGVDMFDCVLPTRLARHHAIYTMRGTVNILNAEWKEREGPVDPESVFPAVSRYSAAYLRHLFHAKEPFAAHLATLHNLAFYARLMDELRKTIRCGDWAALEARYKLCG